jgi:type IV fimbrial biogenesis protein FimT
MAAHFDPHRRTTRAHGQRIDTLPWCTVRNRPYRRREGFTLIELVVSLTIAAFLLLLGVSTWNNWIARYEQRDRAQALSQAMSFTRSEAIKRGHRVDLCPSVDQIHCDPAGRWHAGWLIFADPDGDGDRDPGESLIRMEGAAKKGITVTGNRPVFDYVSYTSYGHTRMASGALQMGTFTVCRQGQNAIDVVLANGGRVRTQETNVPCP